MTRDEFESRYRLLQEVTSTGGATTHNAIGPQGAVVMVHFLEEEVEGRVRSLSELPDAERPDRILTLLDVDGSPVLVTRFIMDFPDLETWLGRLSVEGPSESGPPLGDVPGDFTRMFEAAAASEGSEEPTPRLEADPGGGGEQEPTVTPGGDRNTEERDTEEGSPPEEPAVGEFTALFRSPVPPDASPIPMVEASGMDPETRHREDEEGADPESGGSPGASDDSTSTSPVGRRGEAPGEFTRMFGAMDAPVAPGKEPGKEKETEDVVPRAEPHPPAAPAPKPEPPLPPPPTQPPFRPPGPQVDPLPPTVDRPAARIPDPPEMPPPPPPPPSVRPPPSDPPTMPEGIPEPRYGLPSEPRSKEDRTPPDPGGFTARFASPSPEGPAPGPAMGPDSWPSDPPDRPELDPGADDYLDRLYSERPRHRAPSDNPPPRPALPPLPASDSPTPRGSSGPGAYTRVIAGVKAPMPSTPPGPPASSSQDRKGPEGEGRDSMIPFLIIIGLIVILAGGLLVGYFLLANRG